MAGMNAFFQLINREDGTYLRLVPAKPGGEPLVRQEIQDYLTVRSISYDTLVINQAILDVEGSAEEKVFRLLVSPVLPQDEAVLVQVAANVMSAYFRVYAPSEGGKLLNKDDFITILKKQGIVYGIIEEEIDRFLADRCYCTTYKAAAGTEPIQGQDAKLEYFFNTDTNAKPTLNEDGSVDFYNLNTISQCVEGDILAKLTREIPGQNGKNVLGEVLPPREVKKQVLQYGKNIAVSDDKSSLIAKVNGHVMLIEEKVFVSSVYEVEHVDVSTGNINYDGNVQVNGNVISGFSVKAGGDVIINGVVEGAYVEAGGHITIARGMNGMGRGVLNAGGNIIAKYIENAQVTAKGFIEAEAIIHSRVSSATEVTVNGKKGFITGGVVRAAGGVSAKTIGSAMGVETRIEVGVDPIMKERYTQLRSDIMSAKKTLESIEPTLTAAGKRLGRGEKFPPEQMRYVMQLSTTSKQLQEKLKTDMQEMALIEQVLEAETTAQVKVSGVVYPGARIVISDVSMSVNEAIQYCRFIKYQGSVTMTALQ